MDKAGAKHDAGRKETFDQSPVPPAWRKGFLSSPLEVTDEMYPSAKAITPRHIWISGYSYTFLMASALSRTEL